jgi:hypothetical protein
MKNRTTLTTLMYAWNTSFDDLKDDVSQISFTISDSIDMDVGMHWIGLRQAKTQSETDGMQTFILEGIISLYLTRTMLFSISPVVLILLKSIT